MSRRRRRILLAILLLVFAYVGAQLWDIHRVGHLSRDRNTDCIIVLGAAAWHDKPSPVLTERLNHAIELYKNGKSKFIILTGGYGKGAKHAESEVGSDYCLRMGIPETALRVEKESSNTIDNLREAKKIMSSEQWNSALLVSDPWHLKRARRMANDLDLTVYVSATTSSKFKSLKAKSKFLLGEFLLYHSYLFTGK